MNKIEDKWDKGRVLVLGGSEGTTFTVKNSTEAAQRAGSGLVVALVRKQILTTLESNSGTFKILGFDNYDLESSDIILNLLNRSKALVCGMGIEEPYDQIKDFFKNIIQNSEKCIIIDADVVVMLSHFRDILLERKNKQVTLVLLMNRSETEKYFNELMPQDEIVKKEAISHNAWFVLKGTKTRIFSPDGHINELQTNNLPQMANAGAGDVLSGLIGGFIGRGIPIHKSIMDGINIRKKAAEYYLKTTQDITALPQDIIRSIPFVISSCDENK